MSCLAAITLFFFAVATYASKFETAFDNLRRIGSLPTCSQSFESEWPRLSNSFVWTSDDEDPRSLFRNVVSRNTVIQTAMVQEAIWYKREKTIIEPFRVAFGEKAEEKFAEAFFQGFSQLDRNSIYIVYFGPGEKEYDSLFYSQILPKELIPNGLVKLPPINGMVRLSFKTPKKRTWLPSEIDKQHEIFNFDSPQYSKFEVICEISRVGAENISPPLENMQFYSPMFQVLVSRATGVDPNKILVTAAAHSEAHKGVWDDWSLKEIYRSVFNFSGQDVSPIILLGTSLQDLVKRQNEKASQQFEKYKKRIKKRIVEVKTAANNYQMVSQLKFSSQRFSEGEIDVYFLLDPTTQTIKPELSIKFKDPRKLELRTHDVSGHFEVLPTPFRGDMYENYGIILNRSVLEEWGRGVTEKTVHPMHVAKLTVEGYLDESHLSLVKTELYFLIFRGTLKFFRSHSYSHPLSRENERVSDPWFDYDLISGPIEINYAPFGHFGNLYKYESDVIFQNREKMVLPIDEAILFPWMTNGSHLHRGIWQTFFRDYRSQISYLGNKYFVDADSSIPLPNSFYDDQKFISEAVAKRLSILKLVERNSMTLVDRSHGVQPPAAPGPYIRTYIEVFRNQMNWIEVLKKAGFKSDHL